MNPMVVGGYIRVSTQEQSTKGLSLETQTFEIEEYCKQKGWRLANIYVDAGITARKNLYKRTSFMQMMNDVKAHKINHIVVLRLDRFFRNVYDYHRMMNEFLTPNDCGWSAIKEEYDTTTTNGRLMINLRLSIAEQESDQDSDRIKDVFANRVKDGFIINGNIPFGMAKENKRLVPSENAPIVKDCFETMIQTGSARKTMEIINQRYGLALDYNRVHCILKNERYFGKYRDNTNYCQPIIDKETFDRAQMELTRNSRTRKNKRYYIFSGIIKCGVCGHTMAGATDYRNERKTYRCNNRYLNKKCSNGHSISEKKIEKYLLDNVEELLKDYILQLEAKEKPQPVQKSNRVQIQKKINRLNDLFINEIIDLDELKARKAKLEAQIVEPEAPKKKDLTKINEILNSGFKAIYNDLSAEEKRELWRSVIHKIEINEDKSISIIFL